MNELLWIYEHINHLHGNSLQFHSARVCMTMRKGRSEKGQLRGDTTLLPTSVKVNNACCGLQDLGQKSALSVCGWRRATTKALQSADKSLGGKGHALYNTLNKSCVKGICAYVYFSNDLTSGYVFDNKFRWDFGIWDMLTTGKKKSGLKPMSFGQ